jgi:hypothetical protein
MVLFRALTGPVLKHGPRSLACARVIGTGLNRPILQTKPKGAMKVKAHASRVTEGRCAGAVSKLAGVALPRRLEKVSRETIIETH